LDFENDPFPTLNGSWTVDPQNGAVSFRSYSSSLNPPILHRKELLVTADHPDRYCCLCRGQSLKGHQAYVGHR
jgi:hypothetical protein